MNLINTLSLLIFLVFLASYILKLLILYKKNGIRANVLAKSGKSKEISSTELLVKVTTLTWGLLWFSFSIIDGAGIKNIGLLIRINALRYIGIIALAIGVAVFVTAMVSMKASWRVGIDKKTKTSLITAGIYKYSRNPAFVGFDIMFIGFAFTFTNLLSIVLAILNIVAIHRLILQEEKHLKELFGDNYTEYLSNTPRYIL